MKKFVFMLMALAFSFSEVKAQRFDGVDPCNGPDVQVRIVTAQAGGIWISSKAYGNSTGGLLCGASISSGPANSIRYMGCISSRPLARDASGNYYSTATVNELNTDGYSNIDSRQ